MTNRTPAEAFTPGEYIKDELEARGWSQVELAEIMNRPPRLISEIISGKRLITPETARGLGDAFGTSAQLWLNLESAYQLGKLGRADDAVARRAKLYSKAPIKEMIRRQWIEPSESVEILESQLAQFFGIKSIDDEPDIFPMAARKSDGYGFDVSPSELAWRFRALQLSRCLQVQPFSESRFAGAMDRLKMLTSNAEDVRHVPRVLADAGVRLLVVQHLPQTYFDGACFWLNEQSPVVVLSMRFDRIDWFWFTLMHELAHVKARDGLKAPLPVDSNLVGEGAGAADEKPLMERQADQFACEWLVPPKELDNFVARVRPLYYTDKIVGFAARIKVHPGIVVGQLQHREEIKFSHSRKLLVNVRDHFIQSALTDGWGCVPPVVLSN